MTPPADSIAVRDLRRFRLSEKSTLLIAKSNRICLPMTTVLADLVMGLRDFKPLDAHLEDCRAKKQLSDEESRLLRADLVQLVQAGAFLSTHELSTRGRASAESEPKLSPMGRLLVPTRDRSGILRRCVTSYLANARRFGHALEVTILDDSATESEQRQNQLAVQGLGTEAGAGPGATFRYAGRKETEAFVKRLAEELGGEEPLLAFAFFDPFGIGHATGANRNRGLVDTVGERALWADDDTVCEISRHPEATDGLRFAGGFDFRIQGFPDEATLHSKVELVATDLLATHDALLGRPPLHAVRAFSQKDVEYHRPPLALLEDLAAGTGKVGITWSGIFGDPGGLGPFPFLLLSEPDRRKNLADEATYRRCLQSRQIWQGMAHTAITPAGPFMSTVMGLDHLETLPPFLPVFRGQDAAFGIMVGAGLPGTYLATLGCAVGHFPAERRTDPETALDFLAASLSFDNLISMGVKAFSPGMALGRPDAYLRGLGAHLAEIAALSESDFEEFFLPKAWEEVGWTVARLEQQLKAQDAPEFWKRDVERFIRNAERAAITPDFLVPYSLKAKAHDEPPMRVVQKVYAHCARLISAWPDVERAARRLRKKGTRLSRRL